MPIWFGDKAVLMPWEVFNCVLSQAHLQIPSHGQQGIAEQLIQRH
jgi:hypothetical protein